MDKEKIKNTSGANIEVWVVEECVLHMLLIKFTVYLSPGSLGEAVKSTKN